MQKICDIHAHLLPGIDDGARDWEMTMQMIRASYHAGVREIIATPHYLPWQEELIAGRIPGLCREAMDRAKAELGIEIRIAPGQELYYHNELCERIEEGAALTLAGTRYILVEFSVGASYGELLHGVERLFRGGYRVILAHCERYSCLRDERRLEELLNTGVLLQSNAEEIERGCLNSTKRWLTKRYRREEIHFVGSDMHNLTTRKPISAIQLAWYEKKLPEEYRNRILYQNAAERFHFKQERNEEQSWMKR